jgi:hypothetical protein
MRIAALARLGGVMLREILAVTIGIGMLRWANAWSRTLRLSDAKGRRWLAWRN